MWSTKPIPLQTPPHLAVACPHTRLGTCPSRLRSMASSVWRLPKASTCPHWRCSGLKTCSRAVATSPSRPRGTPSLGGVPLGQSFVGGFLDSRHHPVAGFNALRITVRGAESQAVVTYQMDTRERLNLASAMSAVMDVIASTPGHSDLLTRSALGLLAAGVSFAWHFRRAVHSGISARARLDRRQAQRCRYALAACYRSPRTLGDQSRRCPRSRSGENREAGAVRLGQIRRCARNCKRLVGAPHATGAQNPGNAARGHRSREPGDLPSHGCPHPAGSSGDVRGQPRS